jgi:hypothetical protein
MTHDEFQAAVQRDIQALVQRGQTDGPRFRQYEFTVTLTVPEPVDEDDVDGYTVEDVEALMKRLLASYAPAFKGHRRVVADWELIDHNPVPPTLVDEDDPEPAPRRKLTREERLQGLADRGIDTWDEYNELI